MANEDGVVKEPDVLVEAAGMVFLFFMILLVLGWLFGVDWNEDSVKKRESAPVSAVDVVVAEGDTLSGIASRRGLDWWALAPARDCHRRLYLKGAARW